MKEEEGKNLLNKLIAAGRNHDISLSRKENFMLCQKGEEVEISFYPI